MLLNLDQAPEAIVQSETDEQFDLECIVLPAKTSSIGTAQHPVRIYLGTQPEQLRAERVFVYSIVCVRDPTREYRIYRMSSLSGFDRSGWRTGFTNYRFAIPEFAGFEGRAIYNDVDQVYSDDPGLLFDSDLGRHGYRAVSASDTSVMVMDCARMRDVWSWERATRLDKKQLVADALSHWGPLDSGWNARDLEYRPGKSKLLHYTSLHLQPWRPTPELYSYHHHPLSAVWLRLERAANEQGFELFTAKQPSARFHAAFDALKPISRPALSHLVHGIEGALPDCESWSISVLGGADADSCHGASIRTFDPRNPETADAVLFPRGSIDRLPIADLRWVLAAAFEAADKVLTVQVDCQADDGGSGSELGCARTVHWWREQVGQAALQQPQVRCQLELNSPGRTRRVFEWGPPHPEGTEEDELSIWILCGERMGDNAQLRRLANSLGGRTEEKHLRFNPFSALPSGLLGASRLSLSSRRSDQLTAPWPDLVLASGRRSAPIARWVRRQSDGRTRLVHIGRPWGPLSNFDLVITTPQYGLPVRDNVVHNVLPLNSPDPAELEAAAELWKRTLEGLPRPRIAALIGGAARPFVFDRQAARRLGQELERRARQQQGSLLVAFGSRCSTAVAWELLECLTVPCHTHQPGRGQQNPYLAYLSFADEFVVTGDSASMLADACSTGKPVSLYQLPERPDLRLRVVRSLRRLLAGKTTRASHRGTPKQQGVGGRLYDYLTTLGVINSTREMGLLHDELVLRGLVVPTDEPPMDADPIPLSGDMDRALTRIRAMLHTRPS